MTLLTFDEEAVFESAEWTHKMSAHGKALKENNVRLVLLVHGTFAGNDAFGLFDLFEPIIGETLANTLRVEGKELLNKLAKDVGNYTPQYADALGNALNNGIITKLFTWSSGNFHLARLVGTLELADELATHISKNNIEVNERLLLIGHSHAGQLFALLSHFLANDTQAQQIYSIMAQDEELHVAQQKLLNNLALIKTINLDIVTFGTPVRYSWGMYNNYRLMPIVNHRSEVNILGLLNTMDGDYVQQWGVEGTDMLVLSDINDKFDAVLDKGLDASLLLASLKRKARRQPHYADGAVVSDTFLVDYQDNALSPNCVMTLFGHGVYTRKHTLLFNMTMIVKNWYA